mmetsp:Transcript_50587/g.151277  ORF Transcript_50587/g.151277 Transcript_50587/m.151277 type:complete len:143 (-) Transcript_50587:93-521(-)
MSRPLRRLALPRMARFRLPPAKDDLRHRAPERGSWEPGLGDLEGEGALEAVEADAGGGADVETPPVWEHFESAGPACHEEVYGSPSKGKWRVRFWDHGGGPLSPARRATAPVSVTELAASGLPKEEIYRAIREAYDVKNGDQ